MPQPRQRVPNTGQVEEMRPVPPPNPHQVFPNAVWPGTVGGTEDPEVPSLELSIVAMQHINWKLNLAWFLRYGDSLTEAQVASPRQCEFGRWLYSEGQERYGSCGAMAEIEEAHSQLHEHAKEVVRRYQAGDEAGARAEYGRVEELSELVLAALSKLSTEIGD